jgi:hypothetical protein
MNHFTADIRQTHVAAAVAERQLFVVHAEEVQAGRMEIGD